MEIMQLDAEAQADVQVVFQLTEHRSPLLSHCLWWLCACWSQRWESCLRWTGLTGKDKRCIQMNEACCTEDDSIKMMVQIIISLLSESGGFCEYTTTNQLSLNNLYPSIFYCFIYCLIPFSSPALYYISCCTYNIYMYVSEMSLFM